MGLGLGLVRLSSNIRLERDDFYIYIEEPTIGLLSVQLKSDTCPETLS